MSNTQTLNRRYDAIGWGALFIWWGITELFQFLPDGSGAIGIGLILLGVNAARYAQRHRNQQFFHYARHPGARVGRVGIGRIGLSLPFEIPVFAILLIVSGRDHSRARTVR